MFKKNNFQRSALYTGFAGVSALALLTACSGDDTVPEEEPVDPGVQEDPMQEPLQDDGSDAPGETPMQEDAPAEDPMQEDTAEDPAEGEETDIDGADEDASTSTTGFLGNSISWSL